MEAVLGRLEENGEEEEEEKPVGKEPPKKAIDAAIARLFRKTKSPSDDQVHDVAEKLGMSPHRFEKHIYAKLGALWKKGRKTKTEAISAKARKQLAYQHPRSRVSAESIESQLEAILRRLAEAKWSEREAPTVVGGQARRRMRDVRSDPEFKKRLERWQQKQQARGLPSSLLHHPSIRSARSEAQRSGKVKRMKREKEEGEIIRGMKRKVRPPSKKRAAYVEKLRQEVAAKRRIRNLERLIAKHRTKTEGVSARVKKQLSYRHPQSRISAELAAILASEPTTMGATKSYGVGQNT